ncbi:YihY/virulence factor BrkB family protein [Piscinibacter sp. XHJ-5]|uniref:YihY/virulence factor BrkB family protein n=1 Tax=Piscinibacter sp. XHJ-5 TaxID=3037797 RepID=UPI003297EC9F
MKARQGVELLKKTVTSWVDDRATSMGAALSYYTVFSIAPLLLIVIAVAGLVFGTEAAQGAIVGQLEGLLGERGATIVQELLRSVSEPKKGVISTLVGLVLLLVGATTVFAELQDDLNRIWEAPARNKPSGLWGWIRARMLSFGMILGMGFLMLVSLVISAALSALGGWWGPLFGGWELLAQAVNFVASFAFVTAMFALIYRFMPDVHIRWHDVWIGAAVTALLFTIGKYLIGLYIGKSSVASGFGAAGSLAVLLLWVYYSAQIFLLGAEFTWVYAHSYGSRRTQPAAPHKQPPQKAPVAPAPVPRPPEPVHGGALAARVQRNPVGAIGLATMLGMGTALLWERRRAVPRRSPPVRRRRPEPEPSTAAKLAKGIAAGAASFAGQSVLAAVKRGMKQGWMRQMS